MEKCIVDVLDYFYECNRIPTWVTAGTAQGENDLVYAAVSRKYLKPDKEICAFLALLRARCEGGDSPVFIGAGAELFSCFMFGSKERKYYLVAGPAFNADPMLQLHGKKSAAGYIYQNEFINDSPPPAKETGEFCAFVSALVSLCRQESIGAETLAAGLSVLPPYGDMEGERSGIAQDMLNHDAISPYVIKTLHYIRTRLGDAMTLQNAADYVGINPKYLSKLFVQQTGRRFTEAVQSEKIEEAKRLLRGTDYSVSEISATLAFGSQSYFNKVFSAYTNQSPKEYRSSHNRS